MSTMTELKQLLYVTLIFGVLIGWSLTTIFFLVKYRNIICKD